jgi:hypothetical protein
MNKRMSDVSAHMVSSNNSSRNKIDSFRTAFEARNLELTLFWARSNYFLLLNVAIISGLLFNVHDSVIRLSLSSIGIVTSALWLLVNLGSRFWILRWERKLRTIEGQMVGADLGLFNIRVVDQKKEVEAYMQEGRHGKLKKLTNWLVLRKPPVNDTAIWLSACFCLGWLILLVIFLVKHLDC